ncbi:MAG TPA: hypothetical protein VM940_04955 [Chthoniobacterales bacterium]|jgi:hypothetical protein|nr:hypothetical protein [Chthoniobacterales bacterium]
MKKFLLTATIAIAGLATLVPASQASEDRRRFDYRNDRRDRQERWTDFRQLRAEVYQLDLLFSRVESQMHFGGFRQTRWEYSRLVRDRQHLNFELQQRPLNRLRIHSLIDRMRDQLRELEVRLRARPHRSFYR